MLIQRQSCRSLVVIQENRREVAENAEPSIPSKMTWSSENHAKSLPKGLATPGAVHVDICLASCRACEHSQSLSIHLLDASIALITQAVESWV